jgi:hypothetical protein
MSANVPPGRSNDTPGFSVVAVPDSPKAPPPWLINGIGGVRAGLGFPHRSVDPRGAVVEAASV